MGTGRYLKSRRLGCRSSVGAARGGCADTRHPPLAEGIPAGHFRSGAGGPGDRCLPGRGGGDRPPAGFAGRSLLRHLLGGAVAAMLRLSRQVENATLVAIICDRATAISPPASSIRNRYADGASQAQAAAARRNRWRRASTAFPRRSRCRPGGTRR